MSPPRLMRRTDSSDRKVGREYGGNDPLLMGGPAGGVAFEEEEGLTIGSPAERLARMTQADIEEAVLFVRRSAVQMMERTQAMVDGAVLAAEQVQDQRLDVVETSPEVSTTEVVFDVLFTLAVNSSVAGRLLSNITTRLLRPVLRSSRVFAALPKFAVSRQGQDLKWISSLTKRRGGREAARNTIRRFLTPTEERLNISLHNKVARLIYEGGPDVERNLVAAVKAGERVRNPRAAPVLSVGDSPAVSVLAAAQTYASQQRLAISLSHSIFELWLRLRLTDIEELAEFLTDEVTAEEAAAGMVTWRAHYKLLYEAAIWAKLFGFDTKQPQIRIRGVFPPLAELAGVPKSHLNYMLRRFINPKTERPFASDPLPQAGQVSNLNQYFIAIGNQFRDIQQRQRDDGMLVVTPPVLKPEQ